MTLPPTEQSAAARTRRHWRKTVRPAWREIREPFLLVLALATVVLGTIGYMQYEPNGGSRPYDLLDSFYRSLSLFGLGGAVEPPLPVALQIARFIGPIALGFAAFQGLILLFRDQLQVAGIRLRVRRHVIVAGLGSQGSRLVRSFYDAGLSIVVIELDPANAAIASCRALGVPVIVGDASDSLMLRRGRISRARYLIATSGEDGKNFDIAMTAADTVEGGRHSSVLTVFAHVRDLRLWRALKAEAVAAVDSPEFRLEFFNVFFTAARIMVDRFPPFRDASGVEPAAPHVALVGLDGVGEGLALRIASSWRQTHPAEKLRMTIAGPRADVALAGLVARYPDIADICELEARPAEIAEASFQRGCVLVDADGDCDVTRAFVSLASEAESLTAAIGLHGQPATANVPVVVALDDERSGTALALHREGSEFGRAIEPFGVLTSALTPELLVQGMNETLAQAKHEDYVREQRAAGAREGDSMKPWDELPESLKDSNRRFADGVGTALDAAGCVIAPAPLIDADAALLDFSDDEVEELAKREHDRWVRDLLHDGWGPTSGQKDAGAKLHPLLVPWEELEEEEREKDRQPMRDLPKMLARVGFEIYRPATARRRSPASSSRPASAAAAETSDRRT